MTDMKTKRRLRNQSKQGRPESAFTFVELLAVLGTVALLMAVAVPLLAGNRSSSDRAVCQSNLRQIGRAFTMWADDHEGLFPWLTAGVNQNGLANNAWYLFYLVAAELQTPRVLACPADIERFPAYDWSFATHTGFLAPSVRHNAVSYSIGLGSLQQPAGLLSTDRNVQYTSFSPSCLPALVFGVPQLDWQSPTLDWTDNLHNKSGNILLNDGSVIAAAQSELKTSVKNAVQSPDSTLCVLFPQ
jgi:type II secretory pathway pseudopilin PulG